MSEWTDAMCDTLRTLREQGHSSAEIAAVLRVSRNAVIGKAMRLGLAKKIGPRAPQSQRRREPPKGPSRRVLHIMRAGRGSGMQAAMVPEFDAEPACRSLPAEAIPMEQRKTLLQLTMADCRWPYGDPGEEDFFFCGAPKTEGSSYCTHHTRAAIARRIVISDEERERRRDLGRRMSALNNEKRKAAGT
jgi:GcrA cell cycle regulator